MKISPHLMAGFIFLLFSACTKSTENVTYDLRSAEPAFVMLQLKGNDKNQDSVFHHQEIRSLVDQIKAANVELGFEPLEKKVASFDLEVKGRKTTFMTIRNFEDFEAAERYAKGIEEVLDSKIFGSIGEPFPISVNDYRRCVEQKDFRAYYKYYKRDLDKG